MQNRTGAPALMEMEMEMMLRFEIIPGDLDAAVASARRTSLSARTPLSA